MEHPIVHKRSIQIELLSLQPTKSFQAVRWREKKNNGFYHKTAKRSTSLMDAEWKRDEECAWVYRWWFHQLISSDCVCLSATRKTLCSDTICWWKIADDFLFCFAYSLRWHITSISHKLRMQRYHPRTFIVTECGFSFTHI